MMDATIASQSTLKSVVEGLLELQMFGRFAFEKHSDYVYRVLKSNIMDLTLPPSKTLNEPELAALFRMSRTPIREALYQLKEDLLVEIYPQSASIVSPIDFKIVLETQFLRMAVETAILKQACLRMNSTVISKLDANLELQKAISNQMTDPKNFLALDKTFHAILFEAAGTPLVGQIVEKSMTHIDRLNYYLATQGVPYVKRFYNDHLDFYQLLVSGDASQAERLVSKHILPYDKIKPPIEYPFFFRNDHYIAQ